jgi:nitroreductase
MLEDKPKDLPTAQAGGEPLKPFDRLVLERRATNAFTDEEVPDEYVDAILKLAAQAPSGYNFQPWRFIVVRDEANRKRLQAVAFNQPKIGGAPVVVIAVGMKEEWKETAGEVLREGAERGAGRPETVEQYKNSALGFISTMDAAVWVKPPHR